MLSLVWIVWLYCRCPGHICAHTATYFTGQPNKEQVIDDLLPKCGRVFKDIRVCCRTGIVRTQVTRTLRPGLRTKLS